MLQFFSWIHSRSFSNASSVEAKGKG
jgi:hypothetical protein